MITKKIIFCTLVSVTDVTKMAAFNAFVTIFCVMALTGSISATPVVIWHGMGDTCCYPFSMGHIQELIETNTVEGIKKGTQYVHSLKIGETLSEDTMNGFLMPVNEQVEMACQKIANDPQLADGYHAVGFSQVTYKLVLCIMCNFAHFLLFFQGGQFLRAVAQRCPSPPMRNLVTIGAQHQGVYGFPKCPGEENEFCDNLRQLLTQGAYNPTIQAKLVQAQYWHDPLDYELYASSSVFLADINNEGGARNASYAVNMRRLENFVMVKHNEDSMVEPRISEHFGFYEQGSDTEKVPLQETRLYSEDWIGLRTLDEEGKLIFMELDTDHLSFTDEWFIKEIIRNFFN